MKKKNKVAMNFICTESVKWKQKKRRTIKHI